MAEPRLINDWLKKAEEDFGFASSVLEDSTFYAWNSIAGCVEFRRCLKIRSAFHILFNRVNL
jgi:hypothetical protein